MDHHSIFACILVQSLVIIGCSAQSTPSISIFWVMVSPTIKNSRRQISSVKSLALWQFESALNQKQWEITASPRHRWNDLVASSRPGSIRPPTMGHSNLSGNCFSCLDFSWRQPASVLFHLGCSRTQTTTVIIHGPLPNDLMEIGSYNQETQRPLRHLSLGSGPTSIHPAGFQASRPFLLLSFGGCNASFGCERQFTAI